MTSFLYVLNECPFPADTGPKIYVLSVLELLVEAGVEVKIIGFFGCPRERQRYHEMASRLDAKILGLVPRRRGLSKMWSRALFACSLRLMKSADYSKRAFMRIISRRPVDEFDGVLFDHCRLSHFRLGSDIKAVSIMMCHDCYSNSYRRIVRFNPLLKRKAQSLIKYVVYRRIEALDFSRFDRLWVVGKEDEMTLRRRLKRPITHITIPVDRAYFEAKSENCEQWFEGAQLRCIIGTSMAVDDFSMDVKIWLSSKKYYACDLLRSCKFVGCGPLPLKSLEPLLESVGYFHCGWVSDYSVFLRSAQVFIYPQRVGSGTQNKVIQAMAVGLVCILSEEIATATGATHMKNCFVVEEPRLIWDALKVLSSSPDLLSSLGYDARVFCQERYSYRTVLDAVEEELNQIGDS